MAIVRNILAFLLGLVVGSIINMGLIMLGHHVIPLPAGADVSTMDALAASMPLFGPEHFLFPFLAHALGTLAGATLAYVIAAKRKSVFAYTVGAAFMIGGITNIMMLPGPAWFNVVDILFAYVPMAALGIQLGKRLQGNPTAAN